MRSQISQICKKLLDLMPGQRTLPRSQLYHHAIFNSKFPLMWFILHWCLCNKVNKMHEAKEKTHEEISFVLTLNMVSWTLFCTKPRFRNYRSFCILGPLSHVQLTRDTKTRANKLKMTTFHQQFLLCSPIFTRAPFDKYSTLAHTIWDLFGMCELTISFFINRGVIFHHLQAWKSRKTLPHLNLIAL